MDLNNKRLTQTRENDKLIYELIASPYYTVSRSGEILSRIDRSGNERNVWRRLDTQKQDGYRSVHFKYKNLNAARIVFAKYGNSSLIAEKVINHKDGNKGNNNINNLELVTHGENNLHRYRELEGKKIKDMPKRLGLSGNLQATRDDLIREILKDTNYEIKKDGTVWTKVEKTGKISVKNNWREAGSQNAQGYYVIKYKYKNLRRNRIVYAKFLGELQMDLIVNHMDGDRSNDRPSNLELITQSGNNTHRYQTLGNKPVAGNRKITPKIAEEIRKLNKEGWTNRRLREKFKLAKSTISYIVNDRVWNKEVVL